MKGDADSSVRGGSMGMERLPFPSTPVPGFSHHCGSVHVQAALECGENEVLREVGEKA